MFAFDHSTKKEEKTTIKRIEDGKGDEKKEKSKGHLFKVIPLF